ncbi:MAG: PAS domain-containing sensor histidine kinase [Alysiella sp.]|uniref:sensor histidine kinase n=1 Tax=Alysiella sp. TaxID=1872483 RepID=UPI0026DDA681|nr:PAS domain-containing sensor histidine kinase [Alysiella sp.]MDO4433438.1 PAS domain-containing sensor histidine kinase [Alysiella sp.]
MRPFLTICTLLAFAVLYLLTQSTNSDSTLAPYFWFLASSAAILATVLLIITTRYIWLILRDRKNQVFGSQIARRLSLMFTLVAVLPALFLLGVSAQFISHSIQSWFGDDTKQALERSLNLSKNALNASVANSKQHAQIISNHIIATTQSKHNIQAALSTNEAHTFTQLTVWQLNGTRAPTLLAEHNPNKLPPPEWDNSISLNIQQNHDFTGVEMVQRHLYASGWLMLPEKNGQQYALFFRQPVPEQIATDAQLIESAWSKYAELVFAQKGLQTFFLVTLLVAAVLAILLALAAALYFARRFVEPILLLASGARAVADGDFGQRIEVEQKDELGKLVGLFNDMSGSLARAKMADEQHRIEQEAARHFLERVLDSLSAGVVTLDNTGCLKTFNRSAEKILDLPLAELSGSLPETWAEKSPQHHELTQLFNTFLATENQTEATENPYSAQDEMRILLGKAIRLPEENDSALVVVFDDITALVQAQKEAAWGEVAKRLAHEIRNPLTPIQLSAERLAWKLQDKLDTQSVQILNKSTNTIIKQVAALKEMVEAFRNYARAPTLKLEKINLNEVAEEVLLLYESHACQFIVKMSKIPLLIQADSTAMRQVLHNLLKNAVEAAEDVETPQVEVSSSITSDGNVAIHIQNNGKSFSKQMLHNAFEPYMTDKPNGTGLGLPVVKKIIDEHGGRIALSNLPDGGACIRIELPQAA